MANKIKAAGDKLERRFLPITGRLELRDSDKSSDAIGVVDGYAAVFGELSEDLGGFRETIEPGAFARAISEDDVRALWNHETGAVLGRNRAGTLELEEDDRGLRVRIHLPDTTRGRDARVSIERGDVSQMSFGFYIRRNRWEKADGMPLHVLEDAELFDVSPVTYPAYPQTEAAVRSLRAYLEAEQRQAAELEAAARELRGEGVELERERLEYRLRLERLRG